MLEQGCAPDRLRKNAWIEENPLGLYGLEIGDQKSGGDYVCNATYYLALAHAGRPVFFIHVPPLPPEKTRTIAEQLAPTMRRLAGRALEMSGRS